jgi:hypothetical protein
MPSPRGVTTIGTSFQRAYKCEVECYELTVVTIASEELAVIMGTTEEAPDSKWSAESFKHIEGTKVVLIDPSSSDDKVLRIGVDLSAK